ncbi:hypothetical protein [Actinophytocola sediminis]
MADNRDPYAWVTNGQRVEARFGPVGDHVRATGTVIAYMPEPTVVIQTDSGEHVQWAASLTYPVDMCGAPTEGLVHEVRCNLAANHYGERHRADLGLGTYTWGHLPHPDTAGG